MPRLSFFKAAILTVSTFGTLAPWAFAQDDQPFVMGAMGDSITRAFDAGGVLDNPRNSWSTGQGGLFVRVKSHAVRLGEWLGRPVAAYNVARSGGMSVEMPGQARQLAKLQPDYVTILVGANDLCTWGDGDDTEEAAALSANVRAGIAILVAAKPDVKILVSSLPDMYHLYEVGLEKGCRARWDILPFCRPLLSPDRTEDDRRAFAGRWRDANAALEAAAAAYPANVKFAASVEEAAFTPADLNDKDCFHPSIKGQNLLAKVSWDDGWFADK